jgi:DNA-binding protein H-NS
MAKQTYTQLRKQIAGLEAHAAKVKSEEVAGVVARIRQAIDSYGLSAQDLFASKGGVFKAKASRKNVAKGKGPAAPKYVDGKGGQWVGRGKRPRWLSEALAAGRQLEDFLAEKFKAAVETFSSPPAEVVAPVEKPAAKQPAKKTKKANPVAVANRPMGSAKYSDGAGNSWTGMGPMPKWLKAAVAGGKKREEFLVKG